MKTFLLLLIFPLVYFSFAMKIELEKETNEIDLKDLLNKVDMLEKKLYSKVSDDFNNENERTSEETNEYEENDFFID